MMALAAALRAVSAWIAPRDRRHWWVLVAGLLAIATWQNGFRGSDVKLDRTYRLTASTGIGGEQRFFFFLYHLNLYPLTSDKPILVDTKDEARRLLREEPGALNQDAGVTFRSGDRGRTYLYFVDAWLHGDAIKPSLKPANALAFVAVLLLLFGSFWWIRRPVLGFALVVLFGSNPFQIHSVYSEENIFGWSIIALVLVLAIHVPLLGRRPAGGGYPWVAAVVTAAAMATIRTVRSEPMPVLAGAALAYATLAGAERWKRAALVGVLLVTFVGSNAFWSTTIQRRFEKTQQVMRSVGAVPYEGPLALYHEFWHAVFCGLGDFDTKYGYVWDDRVAYRYALPRLQAMSSKQLQLDTTNASQRASYDGNGKYPVFFSETPGYHEIIRAKVLGDIKRDPWWYAAILAKRVGRILTEPTPVAIAWRSSSLDVRGSLLGVACVPLLVFLIATRRHLYAKLLAMSATTSTAALLVFSDRGVSYYGCFHIVGAVIFAALLLDGAHRWALRVEG